MVGLGVKEDKMSSIELKRKPTTPGEILNEEFLIPMGLTQRELAEHIDCDIKVINRLVNGRCMLTAEMAVKLAATFNTTVDFWMTAQMAVDVYNAYENVITLPERIKYKKAG
jgi:antitoxin HigA-1